MGRVKKGVKCSVIGCEKEAVRSVSRQALASLSLNFDVGGSGRRVYLCEEHYKAYKKAAKKVRRMEKWRWMA